MPNLKGTATGLGIGIVAAAGATNPFGASVMCGRKDATGHIAQGATLHHPSHPSIARRIRTLGPVILRRRLHELRRHWNELRRLQQLSCVKLCGRVLPPSSAAAAEAWAIGPPRG